MKLFLLMFLCVVITDGISAQGVTINGTSTNASTTFVSRNSKIGSGLVLDKNGKVYVLASIFPTLMPSMCYTPTPDTLTATGDGGTGVYTYLWYKDSVAIPTATNPKYSPANLNVTSSNGYYCTITSGLYGSANTTTTTITVIAQPTITAHYNKTGQKVTLTRSGPNVLSQYWKGPNLFFSVDSTLTFNNATSAINGPYTVTGNSFSFINLVPNGDFEAGYTGFTSTYALAAQTAAGLGPEGTYDIVVDPFSRHKDFSHCIDHTTGTGKQMVINGSPASDAIVWSTTVNVEKYTDYQFSYWVQSVFSQNPSQLQLYVNNVAIWNPYTADLGTCTWKQFNYNWNSGSETQAILTLRNKNTIAQGNDFALDDIVFQHVCTTTDTIDVALP